MNITMPRGDLKTISFTIDSGGVPYTELTEIYFTVKKSFANKDFCLQKKLSDGTIVLQADGSYEFRIEPSDTDLLDFGKYVFDIELIKDDSIKQTFVGDFTLTSEVTFSSNE